MDEHDHPLIHSHHEHSDILLLHDGLSAAAEAVATALTEHGSVEEQVAQLQQEQELMHGSTTNTSTSSAIMMENPNKRKDPPQQQDTAGTTMLLSPSQVDDPAAAANHTAKRRATPTRVSWEDRIAMLKAYKEKHGNLLIPIRLKENPSLGKFVHNTREQYKLFHKLTPQNYKKKCSLTTEKIRQLEEMGFVWSTERTKRQNEDWEMRLEQLKEYKLKHGDCLVPHGYSEDASFAEWIHRQRTTYATHIKEGRKNVMVEERMKRLEDIGFNFRVHVDKWEDHYQELAIYKEQHGNCMVPTHYAANPKLGRWVHTQRHQRRLLYKNKKSSMTLERIRLLDSLFFSWEVRPSNNRPRHTWQQRAAQLADFHQQHQHFLIPPDRMPELHNWAAEQKLRLLNLAKHGTDATRTMKTKMSQDRVVLLQGLGFTKDVELAPSLDGRPAVLPDEDDDEEEEEEDDDGDDHDGEPEHVVVNDEELAAAAAAAAVEEHEHHIVHTGQHHQQQQYDDDGVASFAHLSVPSSAESHHNHLGSVASPKDDEYSKYNKVADV